MTTGQKVICINDQFAPEVAQFYTALPKQGVVYVVREVKIGVNAKGEPGEVCLYVIGLNNPTSSKPPFPERGFNAERFRPLDEMKKRQTKERVDAIGKEVYAK